MKNILVALTLMIFSTSAFAGSCPMMAGKVKSKIEQAQKLHDAGVKAHSDGSHGKSEELLNEALDLFKSQLDNEVWGTWQQNAPLLLII